MRTDWIYLMMTLVVLTATAPGCSTTKPVPIVKSEFMQPALPASARQPCADPVQLPDRTLTPRELTPLWAKDRTSLQTCETRRAAAVAAVDAVPVPRAKP